MTDFILGGCVSICLAGGGYAIWMLYDCLRPTDAIEPHSTRLKWRKRIDRMTQIGAAAVFLVVAGTMLFTTGRQHSDDINRGGTSGPAATDSVRLEGIRPLPPGRLFYAMNRPQQPLIGVDFASLPINDDEIRALLRHNPELEWLNLNGTGITDEVLFDVARLPNLTELCLANTRVTDAGLAELTAAKGLIVLTVSGTSITDAGLVHAATLPNLRGLYLRRTLVTEAGLDSLCDLAQLETLSVDDPR